MAQSVLWVDIIPRQNSLNDWITISPHSCNETQVRFDVLKFENTIFEFPECIRMIPCVSSKVLKYICFLGDRSDGVVSQHHPASKPYQWLISISPQSYHEAQVLCDILKVEKPIFGFTEWIRLISWISSKVLRYIGWMGGSSNGVVSQYHPAPKPYQWLNPNFASDLPWGTSSMRCTQI